MQGAELSMERARALGLLQGRYSGTGTGIAYWDEDYLTRLVRAGASYAPHRRDADTLIAWALIRLGVDRALVLRAYDVPAKDVDTLTLERLILTPEERAAAIARVEKEWPDTSGLGQSVAQAGQDTNYKGVR